MPKSAPSANVEYRTAGSGKGVREYREGRGTGGGRGEGGGRSGAGK